MQIVVGVTKAVSERFGKGGIADRMIWFSGFPFLDNKEDDTFNVPVSTVSTAASSLKCLPVTGLTVSDVEKLLSETKYSGFPIVEDVATMILVGYIGRTELRYALDRGRRDKRVPMHAKCSFHPSTRTPSMTPTTPGPGVSFDDLSETGSQVTLDLAKFIDTTPITVHPRLPLETAMELFKKLGPRVILVEFRGKLHGLVTVKDCLKYQFQVEAHENPRQDSGIKDGQEKLWQIMNRVAGFVGSKVGWQKLGRMGHVRLNSADSFIRPTSNASSDGGTPQRGNESAGRVLEMDNH